MTILFPIEIKALEEEFTGTEISSEKILLGIVTKVSI